MKIEKIDENKIKITLSFEELEMRNVTLNDIQKNNAAAEKLFTNLIEESNLSEEFDYDYDDSQLYIEASSDNTDTFILTITKTNILPNINKYSKRGNPLLYKVDSCLYEFVSLDSILDFCDAAKKENDIFFGKNSIYRCSDRYYVLFSESTVKNKKFIRTFSMLSEYCTRYFFNDIYYKAIIEKSDVIIKNRAIQKLIKM